MDEFKPILPSLTRRTALAGTAIAAAVAKLSVASAAQPGGAAPETVVTPLDVTLTINGQPHHLSLDPRTTLLDTLREHLDLTGTKKGCDHGQCGACTVLLNGRRINACLSLAVMHDGDSVTTIEGLGQPDHLHPMQAAFLHHDGYQCGYCTPGQICSATAMLAEAKAGAQRGHGRPHQQAGAERRRDSRTDER